ncbi:MAG: hypothetical protein DLM50_00045 [Candidatus Meridianibacter frigidus]|nr:MAG: hypothetical protein DLM50_00045 [Candidatus Eremiobacteraeota bacterium]
MFGLPGLGRGRVSIDSNENSILSFIGASTLFKTSAEAARIGARAEWSPIGPSNEINFNENAG